MQHLDEGTIHAWLDGALTPDEATRVEAHVNECPQCQAAVAEARGFIAASSRILTALDDAPRGVIPASSPKRRVQPWVWRVAATVVVVATGTILLARGRTTTQYGETSNRVPVSEAQMGRSGEAAAAADSVVIGGATLSQQNAAPTAAAPPTTSAPTQRARPRTFSPTPTPAPARTLDRDQSAPETRNGARLDEGRERAASKIAAAPSAPVAQASPINGAVAFEAATATNIAPRQVQTKRVIGGTQTLYELAPGDTVVLEEQSNSELQNVVVTAVPAAAGAARRAQPSTLSGRTAGVAAPQQKTEAAAPPPPPAVAPLEDARVMEVHRISWLDPSSGRVLILSGRHSQDELQAIRKKIQQLRDAAAASKKLPD